MSNKLAREPMATLKRVEVWIERIDNTSPRLKARMVEWTEMADGEGQVPVWGKCLLSPNRVYDVEMAKTLVRRYLERVCDEIEFVVSL
jgi:hypothetical protein